MAGGDDMAGDDYGDEDEGAAGMGGMEGMGGAGAGGPGGLGQYNLSPEAL